MWPWWPLTTLISMKGIEHKLLLLLVVVLFSFAWRGSRADPFIPVGTINTGSDGDEASLAAQTSGLVFKQTSLMYIYVVQPNQTNTTDTITKKAIFFPPIDKLSKLTIPDSTWHCNFAFPLPKIRLSLKLLLRLGWNNLIGRLCAITTISKKQWWFYRWMHCLRSIAEWPWCAPLLNVDSNTWWSWWWVWCGEIFALCIVDPGLVSLISVFYSFYLLCHQQNEPRQFVSLCICLWLKLNKQGLFVPRGRFWRLHLCSGFILAGRRNGTWYT